MVRCLTSVNLEGARQSILRGGKFADSLALLACQRRRRVGMKKQCFAHVEGHENPPGLAPRLTAGGASSEAMRSSIQMKQSVGAPWLDHFQSRGHGIRAGWPCG